MSDTTLPVEFSIGKLLVEVLTLVFHRCERRVKDRINLSHTCRQWRSIVVSTSNLWTKLNVNLIYSSNSPPKMFDNYLALIRLQHDRAEGQLLDVHWAITGHDDHDLRLIQLLNEKDSFRRWRTLQVHFAPKATPWYTESDYPNLTFPILESLEVISGYLHPVMGVIDRTITSKFKVIRMDSRDLSPYQVSDYCNNMIEHVSHLLIRTSIYKPLSPNVTTVVAAGATISDPNHVESYVLLHCLFWTVTLSHLTTLIVRNMIHVQDSSVVFLPSLRNFECMIVTLRGLATFSTPTLQKLKLNGGSDMAAMMEIDSMPLYNDTSTQSRMSKDCLYIPLTRGELAMDRQWSITKLIKFLEWSPYAERVSLSLNDEGDVRQVLHYFIERPYPEGMRGLTELKIRGPYKSRDLKSMAGLAEKLVKRRKEELGVKLMIYGLNG